MAHHVLVEPTSASSAGTDVGYFSESSKPSTPGSTPSSTPAPTNAFAPPAHPALSKTSAPVAKPAIERDFPAPVSDLDIESALERQPGRWTIKGQREANQRRAQGHAETDAEAKAKRAKEFEATKQDLLASFRC
jgi:hypothetical protein